MFDLDIRFCPLLALSGYRVAPHMSANDPKRTSDDPSSCQSNRWRCFAMHVPYTANCSSCHTWKIYFATTILKLICGIRFPPACCAHSSARNYISSLQLGNVSLPLRIRISVLDCVYFYFSNKRATVRGCVTVPAALRGLDAPRSILTEKFWVLRMSATTIYVGRADSCSTQSACDVVS